MRKGLLKLAVLLIVAVFTVTVAYAQETKLDYTLTIDGELMDASVYQEEDILFIPLRAICEKLGFNVEWEAETRTVILEKLPVYITFSADADGYTFAKTAPMLLGNAPKIINDRTYVPSSFIDEVLQGTIEVTENAIDIKWAVEEEGTEETTEKTLYNKVTFIEKSEQGRILVNHFYIGDMLLNVTEETVIKNEAGEILTVDDLTTEKELKVKLGDAMTMSIPPQVNALEIIVTENLAPVTKSGIVSEIVENEGKIEQIIIGEYEDNENFFAINIGEETVIDAAEIKVGSEITASVSATSTMSIPPQFSGYSVRVIK